MAVDGVCVFMRSIWMCVPWWGNAAARFWRLERDQSRWGRRSRMFSWKRARKEFPPWAGSRQERDRSLSEHSTSPPRRETCPDRSRKGNISPHILVWIRKDVCLYFFTLRKVCRTSEGYARAKCPSHFRGSQVSYATCRHRPTGQALPFRVISPVSCYDRQLNGCVYEHSFFGWEFDFHYF